MYVHEEVAVPPHDEEEAALACGSNGYKHITVGKDGTKTDEDEDGKWLTASAAIGGPYLPAFSVSLTTSLPARLL